MKSPLLPEHIEDQKALSKLLEILQLRFGKEINVTRGQDNPIIYEFPFEVAQCEQAVILVDTEETEYLYESLNNPHIIHRRPEMEVRQKYLSDYKLKKIPSSETGLDFCVEITTPDGKTVYLIAKSDYPAVQNTGVQKRSDEIRKKLNVYFDQQRGKNIPQEEYEAAKALTGEHPYVVPILYGIKPAGEIGKIDHERRGGLQGLWEKLLKEIPEVKSIPYKGLGNSKDVVFFNTVAIEQMVKDHPDIFSKIHIDNSVNAEEVIKRTLGLENSLTESTQTPEITNAVGLLLGYDRESVLNYAENSKSTQGESFHKYNIWNVGYRIDSANQNDELKQLKQSYEDLFKIIEALLAEGLSPMEVLHKIFKIGKHKMIQKSTRTGISQIL